MRSARLRAAVGAAFACAAIFPAAAAASVKITTDPSLTPGFKRSISDYVVRCVPGKQIAVSVSASGGDTVDVAGHGKRTGDYTVQLTRKTGAAFTLGVDAAGRTTTHHVRCLPTDFPTWVARRSGTPQAQWYVLTPIGPHTNGYVAIFDTNGVPVWWMHASSYGPWDGKLLTNGDLAWGHSLNTHFGIYPSEEWEERKLDGTLVRTLKTVGSVTDIHDLEQMPNGDFLLDSYRQRATTVDLSRWGGPKHAHVYDGVLQEITPAGKLVWSWNSKDHIKLAESKYWLPDTIQATNREPADQRIYDLVHLNSIEPDGDGFVVSARFLDAVFRIDKKTGNVTWKVGGTKTSKSLTVLNDPQASLPFNGQHDARLYGDHTLTVFDNGTQGHKRPRAVRYRIDTQNRTATLLEQIKQSETPRSPWGGSARKLSTGDWVVYWGGTKLMTESSPSGKQVLGILFGGDIYSYRAFPIEPGRLSPSTLRRAMSQIAHANRGEIGR